MTAPSLPASTGYRDGGGRFVKGCPGGPGNPYVRQVARLKSALYEALTQDDIRAVVQRMRDKALAGDVAAARLLLEYGLGKPLPGALASAIDAAAADRWSQDKLSRLTDEDLLALERIAGKAEGLDDEEGDSGQGQP
jgi:hypothetical protein